jgi:predicted enzyme related to lactoylglutathione lyase
MACACPGAPELRGGLRAAAAARRSYSARVAIARFPVVVLDCPDAELLARFYSALLDWQLQPGDGNMWFIRAEYGDALGFQQVAGFTPPRWPAQDVPQQMHLDVTVDDLDVAETAVRALGATKHEHQPGTTFRVFLDPAGHPFCLCQE